jgi:hypothetical protein
VQAIHPLLPMPYSTNHFAPNYLTATDDLAFLQVKKIGSDPNFMIPISLIAMINAAKARAVQYYILLMQQANQEVFILGPNALPDEPNRASRAGKK